MRSKFLCYFLTFHFIGAQFIELCLDNSYSKFVYENQKEKNSEDDSKVKNEKESDEEYKIEIDFYNKFPLKSISEFIKNRYNFRSKLHLGIIQEIHLPPPENY